MKPQTFKIMNTNDEQEGETIIKYFGNVKFEIFPGKDYAETEYGKIYKEEIKRVTDWIENFNPPKLIGYSLCIYNRNNKHQMVPLDDLLTGRRFQIGFGCEPGRLIELKEIYKVFEKDENKFVTSFEEGVWYKHKYSKALAVYGLGYGFDYYGKWIDSEEGNWGWRYGHWYKATKEEVKQRLLEYAKENYKKLDVIESLNYYKRFIRVQYPLRINGTSEVCDNNYWKLFKNGKWARKVKLKTR